MSRNKLVVYGLALVSILVLATRKAFSAIRLDYKAPSNPVNIPFWELFDKWSGKMDVPWRVMVSLVQAESAFRPNAVNSESAADRRLGRDVESIGLGQILYPDTARGLDPNVNRNDLFDPDTNLRLVAMLLKELLRRFPQHDEDGFPNDAVSAYNAGVPTSKNSVYVQRVRGFWEKYT